MVAPHEALPAPAGQQARRDFTVKKLNHAGARAPRLSTSFAFALSGTVGLVTTDRLWLTLMISSGTPALGFCPYTAVLP
jgi:hypothetical protein